MIRGIIFDEDGVLIDTEKIYYQIDKDLLALRGKDFPMNVYTESYSGRPWKENIFHLVHDYSLDITEEEAFKEIRESENKYFSLPISPKEGAEEILISLKKQGYKIALATSSTKEMGLKKLRNASIDITFDACCFAEDVKRGKPDPDIFLLAVEKLGLNKEECLVIEDSENGVKAALNGGIRVICIPDLKEPSQEIKSSCTAVLKNLENLDIFLKSVL